MYNNEEVDIKRILEIIYSKKLLIILILLLSIVMGYTYSYYYKVPEYKSSVTILLVADINKENQELTQTDLTLNSGLISTYSSIAKSTNVIGKTIENLKLNMSVEELQKNIEVEQINQTQFIKISVKNRNPQEAKDIASQLAIVFSEQIKEIYNIENTNIVDEAEVESKPCNLNHIKDISIFSVIGIFTGILLVMIIYFFDDSIKDEKDIEQNVKLKSIGTLPIDKDNEELIIQTNPKSHIVECIKTTRTNILYASNKKAILITSNKQKEGKSWVANNLAVSFAQADKKVILIDTDLRKESNRNEIFEIEKGEGLSDFIRDITDDKIENLEKSKKYIKQTKIPNLYILQNGTIPPNPSELISSNNMKKIIDLLKNMYDVILLDGAPCSLVADSIALSAMVDSTIIVAQSRKTKINDLKKTKKSIEDVNGKIFGVLLNKAELQKGKYYGKKYGYYYGKEETEEDKEKQEKSETQKLVSLDELIELAKIKINDNLLNEPEEIEEDNQIDEENTQINYEIKNDIIKEINKIKESFAKMKEENAKKHNDEINKLKEIQINNNQQLLEKLDKMNYNNKLDEINSKIENNNYKELIEELNTQIANSKEEIKNISNQIINNKEKFETINEQIINNGEEIKGINEKIVNNGEEFKQLNEQIVDNGEKIKQINEQIINNGEEIKTINEQISDNEEKINEINQQIIDDKELYTNILQEIQDKNNENIENLIQKFIQEMQKFNSDIENLKQLQINNSNILNRIESMNYEKKIEEINKKIQKNTDVESKSDNIISFESFWEKRKNNKRVFKLDETITYEDLERLSNCIIDLKDNATSEVAL